MNWHILLNKIYSENRTNIERDKIIRIVKLGVRHNVFKSRKNFSLNY